MNETRLVAAYKAARERREEKQRAARFAREMARSVFGAAYVDDAGQAEIRRASNTTRVRSTERRAG